MTKSNKAPRKYLLLISLGAEELGPKEGWDEWYETRHAAEKARAKARANGWRTQIVSREA